MTEKIAATARAQLPFAQSCENNQAPIFEVLKTALANSQHLLEVGSGTGQHSIYFAPRLPHLVWQTSELNENHAGIAAWHQAYPAPNLRAPLEMDLSRSDWPAIQGAAPIDAIFTSNTCHIVAWPLVERLFSMAGQHLPEGGVLAIYGPFNYGGTFTSVSNQAFDAWLRQRDPASGIRDFEDMQALAEKNQLALIHDHAMPANNRVLVFQKHGA